MQDIKDIGVYNPPVKAIITTILPVDTGVVLFINNQPLKAVYDATKSKCDIIWAGQVVWTLITPTEAHAKLLFLKLRPTFVVTKELISFARKKKWSNEPAVRDEAYCYYTNITG